VAGIDAANGERPWPARRVDAVEELAAEYAAGWPAWGHRKIAAMMRADGHEVATSTVQRALRRRGLLLPQGFRADRRVLDGAATARARSHLGLCAPTCLAVCWSNNREPQRAFYGNRYGLTYPVLQHYGVELWVREVGGAIDPDSEPHDLVMSVFTGMSRGERNRIRVRGADRDVGGLRRHDGPDAREPQSVSSDNRMRISSNVRRTAITARPASFATIASASSSWTSPMCVDDCMPMSALVPFSKAAWWWM
jgi:hypothetical protein